MIYAVDYDGTLVNDGLPNIDLMNTLVVLQSQGHTIILWTCRNGKRLVEAIRTCAAYGHRFDYINENATETVRHLGYNPRKVLADFYIDDKAIPIVFNKGN